MPQRRQQMEQDVRRPRVRKRLPSDPKLAYVRERRDTARLQTLQGHKLEPYDVVVELQPGKVRKGRHDMMETRHRDGERAVLVRGRTPYKRRQARSDAPWESVRIVGDHDVAQLEPPQSWGVSSIQKTGSRPRRAHVAVHRDAT